jgi:hypothetical protein
MMISSKIIINLKLNGTKKSVFHQSLYRNNSIVLNLFHESKKFLRLKVTILFTINITINWPNLISAHKQEFSFREIFYLLVNFCFVRKKYLNFNTSFNLDETWIVFSNNLKAPKDWFHCGLCYLWFRIRLRV